MLPAGNGFAFGNGFNAKRQRIRSRRAVGVPPLCDVFHRGWQLIIFLAGSHQ